MKELNFTVDMSKCIKCGLCIKDCSVEAISFGADGYPVADECKCFACQHCLAVCPVGAISIFNKNSQNSFTNKNIINPQDLESLIKTRRSCRHYKNENVDKEKLQKLKNILNWVPTGCNYRGLHFSIVEDFKIMNEIKTDLGEFLKSVPFGFDENTVLRNAPHMIVVSVDEKSPCKDYDPIIALSYFELYAQSMGIGTLWCGLAYNTFSRCETILNKLQIPAGYKLAYVMLFGNPDISYQRSIQPDEYEITSIK